MSCSDRRCNKADLPLSTIIGRSWRPGGHPEAEIPLTPTCGHWSGQPSWSYGEVLSCAVGNRISLSSCSNQPEKQVAAVVVSVAEHPQPKFNADELVVTARSEDGAMGSVSVLRARLRCRVGDTVGAREQGIALRLERSACER